MMKFQRNSRSLQFTFMLIAIAFSLALGSSAFAQFPPDQGQSGQGDQSNQPDPPGRVARLNYMQGSVSFEPAGTQDWVDANPNRPLTTGDNLWVDQNSRGELHVGSTALRLSNQTGISFLNLNDQAVQIQLAQGSLDIRVRELDPSEAYEIDTPNLSFSILRPGEYRLDVDPNGGFTMITVRAGGGEADANGQSYNVNPGQQYAFSGTDQVTYDAHRAPNYDDFDTWCVSRSQNEDRSISAQYVSRDVIGYDDLDANGTWRQDSEYGPVWFPNGVAVDWVPYHYGHWVFVAPWGWTWVEAEPWGFAPFHYGRWAVVGGVWGWCPGPVIAVGAPVRPVYAPALVGFVGGGGFSVSLAIGGGAGVAWFPLGPRDVWVPGYHASALYVRNVNVTNTRIVNVTQVNNVYINRGSGRNDYTYARNTNAVTAVTRDTFVNGQQVNRAAVRVNAQDIQNPHVMQGAPLQPAHGAYVGPNRAAKALPPAALANRTVVTKMAPSANAATMGHTRPFGGAAPGNHPAQVNNAGGQPNVQQPNGQSQQPARPGFQRFQQPQGQNSNQGGNANPSNGTNNSNPNFDRRNQQNIQQNGQQNGQPNGQPPQQTAAPNTNAPQSNSNANPQDTRRNGGFPPASRTEQNTNQNNNAIQNQPNGQSQQNANPNTNAPQGNSNANPQDSRRNGGFQPFSRPGTNANPNGTSPNNNTNQNQQLNNSPSPNTASPSSNPNSNPGADHPRPTAPIQPPPANTNNSNTDQHSAPGFGRPARMNQNTDAGSNPVRSNTTHTAPPQAQSQPQGGTQSQSTAPPKTDKKADNKTDDKNSKDKKDDKDNK